MVIPTPTKQGTQTPWTYNKNNELVSAEVATYGYDNNGNTTSKTEGGVTTTFGYSATDRLTSVLLPDGRTATYMYDPFGRRIKKQVGSEVTIYVYADEGLIGEYSQAGTVTKTYGWRPNGIWGTNPVFQQENGQYYFYHNDHLGTPQTMTDAAGDIVWEATYDAFGKAAVDPDSTIVNNLRFPGQYWDEETGLHYNWHRYYDPGVGRYTQEDPLGLLGHINVYSYTGNRVLNFIDSLGLCPVSNPSEDCKKALMAVGARTDALKRIMENWNVIENAAKKYGLEPSFLASIAIRETGARVINQHGGGKGRGMFQIDIGQNPSVTEEQANNVAWSADFAAKMLAANRNTIAKKIAKKGVIFTPEEMSQATAASYNLGPGGISGNPKTIDDGTEPNGDYGRTVLDLMAKCFTSTVVAPPRPPFKGFKNYTHF